MDRGKWPAGSRTVLAVLWQGILLWLVLALFEALFRHAVTGVPWGGLLHAGLLRDATLYLVIFLLVFRTSLLAVTLGFLLLPYLVFGIGWLAPWLACLWLPLLAACAWLAWRHTPVAALPQQMGWEQVLGFCAVIAWVHLAGAGGVGFQADDYNMHNGRLKDLVEYPWPVRYGDDQNLVYYIGYYLPAAALGKWLGFAVAYQAMYFWTLLGVAIAFRWMLVLTQLRWTLLAALLLVFFGGLDVVGYWVTHHGAIVPQGVLTPPEDLLDFWMFRPFGSFIGGYPSNTFQLYWAPHQVIAGWIVGALLLHACFQGSYRSAGFFYALLALWSPLVMLAAAPVFLLLLCCNGRKGLASAFSPESLLGGGAIVLLFVAFYFSGSAAENPRAWLWEIIRWQEQWPLLLLFYALSWGVLSLVLLPGVLRLDAPLRRGFAAVVLALLLLSFAWYGLFSDMMVRGSALLMFLLMAYAGRVLGLALQQRRWLYAGALSAVLALSGMSAHWNMVRAWLNYGWQQPAVRAPDHGGASQFLGPDGTFFQRHLAAPR